MIGKDGHRVVSEGRNLLRYFHFNWKNKLHIISQSSVSDIYPFLSTN